MINYIYILYETVGYDIIVFHSMIEILERLNENYDINLLNNVIGELVI